MFGGFGDMMGNMKKMMEVSKAAQVLQKELAGTYVECTDDKNLVVATFSCDSKPVSVKISPEGMSRSSEELSAAVTKAVSAASAKATETSKTRTTELFDRYGIPVPEGFM